MEGVTHTHTHTQVQETHNHRNMCHSAQERKGWVRGPDGVAGTRTSDCDASATQSPHTPLCLLPPLAHARIYTRTVHPRAPWPTTLAPPWPEPATAHGQAGVWDPRGQDQDGGAAPQQPQPHRRAGTGGCWWAAKALEQVCACVCVRVCVKICFCVGVRGLGPLRAHACLCESKRVS